VCKLVRLPDSHYEHAASASRPPAHACPVAHSCVGLIAEYVRLLGTACCADPHVLIGARNQFSYCEHCELHVTPSVSETVFMSRVITDFAEVAVSRTSEWLAPCQPEHHTCWLEMPARQSGHVFAAETATTSERCKVITNCHAIATWSTVWCFL
jgi:hypothetical protein